MSATDVDSKENVAEHVNEMSGEITILDNISLPAEVCGIISEFLAWDQAFGTLASLNLASHDILDETLPVLYETVTFENVDIFSDMFHPVADVSTFPKRFHYTKFAIVLEQGTFWNRLKELPKLALSFCLRDGHHSAFYANNDEFNSPPTWYKLRLQKPLTRRSIFFWTPRARHQGPPSRYHLHEKAKTAANTGLQTKCISKPSFLLEQLTIDNGAYLKPEEGVSDDETWETSVAFANTAVESIDSGSSCHIVATVFELLKLRRHMGQWKEWRLEAKHKFQFDLDLRLSLTQLHVFLVKYPSVLTNQPEILFNVFQIHVRGDNRSDAPANALEGIRDALTHQTWSSQDALLFTGLHEHTALTICTSATAYMSESLKISYPRTGMEVSVVTEYLEHEQRDDHDGGHFGVSDDSDDGDHEAMTREYKWPVGKSPETHYKSMSIMVA
ncbi:hypothetical protein QFC22_003751 [Naganishia vaughanmartiniae]|uniref:Uncharacterized protein n=1 Tax=Naganishia vaughanmartiniae TaxID=1424756 RepID=A0ACC2X6Z6_9TREE|nr:hypothetical protein QFC22_003751 [Naganishia vaughanmartiniae]